jgi:mRNA interferase RelE/StbE
MPAGAPGRTAGGETRAGTFAPLPRALRKVDRPFVERIKAATESLRENPRPTGAKMLTGMHGVLRIRVAGDYRVLYTVDDDRLVILVVDAGHRRQIYR